jgi:hypothetical protein
MALARIPAEADGMMQARGVDLSQGGARLAHKGVGRRDPVVSVGTIGAPRADSQDLPLGHPQILRNVGDLTGASLTDHSSVTGRDIEQSIVVVTRL